ncbi:hypothetical protein [Phaeobacter sp. B1627]|uniref:hypothetical protein n=1 Tax=Phaeobacter sp. B1627 TaxID=2583809 RepID=UPI00111B72A7|nr:hypothetical protein [Phaeobacter sp. B1627]TNJ38484.1 hypothetical protein FGE21_19635 [Phaeobacter sp. B1627]
MDAKKIGSISDSQAFLVELFPNADHSEDYLFGYLSRYTGYLCKSIWQGNVREKDFIRAISWIFAICSKSEISLEDSLLQRFPSVCPYCIASPCQCLETNKAPVAYVPAYKIQEELEAKAMVLRNAGTILDFDAAISILSKVYPNNKVIWTYGGPWRHLVKIQEETSEVHEALCGVMEDKLPKSLLGEEVADTLAWVLSAWSIVFPDKSLNESFIVYYQRGCPVCLKAVCFCSKRAERSSAFISSDALDEIGSQVEELSTMFQDHKEELLELQKSLQAASSEQSEPVATNAVKQTKNTIERLESGLEATDRNAKRAASIFGSISKLLEGFLS